MEYEWPGNVRELRNVIERSLIIQRGQTLKPSLLLRSGQNSSTINMDNDAGSEYEVEPLETMEKQCIGRALKKYSGNYSQTAKALGISLSTLKRKVKQYKLAGIG
jgi:transcriptional regulator with PAS, ATPase and Fis domain